MIAYAPILQRAIAVALLALLAGAAAPARAALLANAPTRLQVIPGPGALVNQAPYRYVTDRFDAASVRIEPRGP